MAWFKRVEKGIVTPTDQKKETPDGLWYKCPECKTVATMAEHKRLLAVCGNCCHHDRIDAADNFEFLFDQGAFTELDANLTSGPDPLNILEPNVLTKDELCAGVTPGSVTACP